MKLSDLKKAIEKFVSTKERGKKLKAKKLRNTVDGLVQKQKTLEKSYAKETVDKTKNKLKIKLKVVNAHIKKGRQLLRDLDT